MRALSVDARRALWLEARRRSRQSPAYWLLRSGHALAILTAIFAVLFFLQIQCEPDEVLVRVYLPILCCFIVGDLAVGLLITFCLRRAIVQILAEELKQTTT